MSIKNAQKSCEKICEEDMRLEGTFWSAAVNNKNSDSLCASAHPFVDQSILGRSCPRAHRDITVFGNLYKVELVHAPR